MLRKILIDARLDSRSVAGLLGVNATIFDDWVAGRRAIPESIVPTLATILGVQPDAFSPSAKAAQAGAIWFKLRRDELTEADRECVFLIRQLGHFLNELELVTEEPRSAWRVAFESVFKGVDHQASPRNQGQQAARIFRGQRALAHGATGIGEAIRPYLRTLGLLVLESNFSDSVLEGCSFYVGQRPNDRPCVFANNYATDWYRRNVILMHEVAHVIFDAQAEAASLDFRAFDSISDPNVQDLQEQRAHAFAQETLVPKEVLRHITQTRGLNWDALTPPDLALIVALTAVEKRMVISAAVAADFVAPDAAEQYLGMDIRDELGKIDSHALSTDEYLASIGPDKALPFTGKRTTTIPRRKLVLPVGYITRVLDAVQDERISSARAAELLMIDPDTFRQRFPSATAAWTE
jgi:Zn-dependent peptidase ImmA (M78 family)